MPATKRATTSEVLIANYRRVLLALKRSTPYLGPAGERCHICKGEGRTCPRCSAIRENEACLTEFGHEVEA